MPSKIVPVILCGGSGTRLWPRSKAVKPKPFIPLLGERTLYQDTLERCADRSIFAAPLVVVGKAHLPMAIPQAAEIAPDARFVVEPMGKNTAPAIALAALALDPDDLMLVCPSDHFIGDTSAFIDSARNAATLASQGYLVSFGIEATAPETGYGYIMRGEPIDPGFRIQSFVEKPDRATAIEFLAKGNYVWNGGIFAFRARDFLTELARYRPDMADSAKAAFASAKRDGNQIHPNDRIFGEIQGESVDYAVMELTDEAAMVEASMNWSDIGNWDALMGKREPDQNGNVLCGSGEMIGTSGSMIDTDGPHVTVVGLDNVIVVVDGDDVLITSRDCVQWVNEAERCRSQ